MDPDWQPPEYCDDYTGGGGGLQFDISSLEVLAPQEVYPGQQFQVTAWYEWPGDLVRNFDYYPVNQECARVIGETEMYPVFKMSVSGIGWTGFPLPATSQREEIGSELYVEPYTNPDAGGNGYPATQSLCESRPNYFGFAQRWPDETLHGPTYSTSAYGKVDSLSPRNPDRGIYERTWTLTAPTTAGTSTFTLDVTPYVEYDAQTRYPVYTHYFCNSWCRKFANTKSVAEAGDRIFSSANGYAAKKTETFTITVQNIDVDVDIKIEDPDGNMVDGPVSTRYGETVTIEWNNNSENAAACWLVTTINGEHDWDMLSTDPNSSEYYRHGSREVVIREDQSFRYRCRTPNNTFVEDTTSSSVFVPQGQITLKVRPHTGLIVGQEDNLLKKLAKTAYALIDNTGVDLLTVEEGSNIELLYTVQDVGSCRASWVSNSVLENIPLNGSEHSGSIVLTDLTSSRRFNIWCRDILGNVVTDDATVNVRDDVTVNTSEALQFDLSISAGPNIDPSLVERREITVTKNGDEINGSPFLIENPETLVSVQVSFNPGDQFIFEGETITDPNTGNTYTPEVCIALPDGSERCDTLPGGDTPTSFIDRFTKKVFAQIIPLPDDPSGHTYYDTTEDDIGATRAVNALYDDTTHCYFEHFDWGGGVKTKIVDENDNPVTYSWTAVNDADDSLIASGDWSGNRPVSHWRTFAIPDVDVQTTFTYSLTCQGEEDEQGITESVYLIVNPGPDFSLTIDPDELEIPGLTGPTIPQCATVGLISENGFSDSVSLSLDYSGAPALQGKLTADFTPSTLMPTASSQGFFEKLFAGFAQKVLAIDDEPQPPVDYNSSQLCITLESRVPRGSYTLQVKGDPADSQFENRRFSN
jgi:hypothetical protein